MSSKKIEYKVIRIRECVLGFPSLHEKSTPVGYDNTEPKYKADFILDPSNPEHVKVLKETKAEDSRIREFFGLGVDDCEPQQFMLRGDKNKNKSKEVYEGYAGMYYISGKSIDPVRCRYRNNKTDMTKEEIQKYLYGGAIVNATFSLYLQKDGKAVRCGLRTIQFVRDGERFGRGAVSDDEFEELPDGDLDMDWDNLDGDDDIGDDLGLGKKSNDDFDDDIPF